MKYLIKYSPEMTTKSRVVRNRFCKQLRKNVARILRDKLDLPDTASAPHDPDAAEVEVSWDYLQVSLPQSRAALAAEVEQVLGNTPGIWSYQKVEQQALSSFEQILALVQSVYAGQLAGKSFVVRCKRSGKHPFSSVDIERYLGGELLKNTLARAVSLKHPEIRVMLEIRDDKVFVGGKIVTGIGGFPIGTQESAISLISGGFDSAVATYLAMRRGLRTHFLFFNLGGREHELAVKEVAWYLWSRFGMSHGVHFISVPFEAVVAEILEQVENSQMGVVLKRMMLRAAGQVADRLKVEALVTGESIAQVSSQTLTNLAVIDEVTPRLVLRPLIMSDKQSIVDMARQIGTAEFSAQIPEYCGIISVRPTTRAKRHKVAHEEARFNMQILDEAVAALVQLDIRRITEDQAHPLPEVPESDQIQPGEVVIDIRHPDEEERQPLRLGGVQVLRIPFYRLNAGFAELDPAHRYLLYCSKGVMSRLHAVHLLEQGVDYVGVYRP